MNRVSCLLRLSVLGLMALAAVPAGAFPRPPEELGREVEGLAGRAVGASAEVAVDSAAVEIASGEEAFHFIDPTLRIADRAPSPPIPSTILRPSELARLLAEMAEGSTPSETSPAAPASDAAGAGAATGTSEREPAPADFSLPRSLPLREVEAVPPVALSWDDPAEPAIRTGLRPAHPGLDPSGDPDPAGFSAAPDSGLAPVEASPAALTFAFGREIPTLTCVPTRACSIELQAGEVVDGYVVGDPIRWQTAELAQGEGPSVAPVLVVKPAGFDLRTNLLVTTNRRTYHAELVSPAERRAGETAYEHVRFWYPAELAARRRSADAVRAEAETARAASSPVPQGLDPSRLAWDYRIDGPGRGKRLPWTPGIVFDDGTRTYLQLPAGLAQLPAAFGLLPDGTLVPANAHLSGSWLIVPATYERLELVSGSGRSRRSLRIAKGGAR